MWVQTSVPFRALCLNAQGHSALRPSFLTLVHDETTGFFFLETTLTSVTQTPESGGVFSIAFWQILAEQVEHQRTVEKISLFPHVSPMNHDAHNAHVPCVWTSWTFI